MRYSRWSGQADPKFVYFAYNSYVDSAGPLSAYRSRPGRYRITATQLGGGGVGQLAYQFTKLDGTQYTVAICGGKFYTLNWGTTTWTEVVTAANFATATITLSTTARCFAVTLADKMIVSDGVNTPWMWDGTAGAGGLTKLTNCPVLYGQPTVYAAKLFGIKNTNRAAYVWSEENDPTTGYEAGGFSNIFVASQTGSDPLFAVRGINDGFYFWRQKSVGVMRGASNEEFQSATTMDSFSGAGTTSPRGVLYHNNTFWFPDERGRPWSLSPGGQMQPLWEQTSLLYPTDTGDDEAIVNAGVEVATTTTDLLHMQTVPVPILGGVLFGCNPSNQSGADLHGGLYFNGDGIAHGFWFWTTSDATVAGAMGVALNSVTNLTEVLCIDDTGFTYAFGKVGQWYDQNDAGSNTSVQVNITASRHGTASGVELLFDQIDITTDVRSTAAVAITAIIPTSRDPVPGSSLQVNATTTLSVQEKRTAFGLNRMGRWVQPQILLSSTGNYPMALHGYTIHAIPVSSSPTVP
jgi:hypothetical protein